MDFGEGAFSSGPVLRPQEGRSDPSSAPLCLPELSPGPLL